MAKKTELAARKGGRTVKGRAMIDGIDGELCLECFWGPEEESLSCDMLLGHKGRHKCFLPYMGADGVIFEWTDEAWDDYSPHQTFKGWTE